MQDLLGAFPGFARLHHVVFPLTNVFVCKSSADLASTLRHLGYPAGFYNSSLSSDPERFFGVHRGWFVDLVLVVLRVDNLWLVGHFRFESPWWSLLFSAAQYHWSKNVQEALAGALKDTSDCASSDSDFFAKFRDALSLDADAWVQQAQRERGATHLLFACIFMRMRHFLDVNQSLIDNGI